MAGVLHVCGLIRVMANPAKQLHEILVQWNSKPNASTAENRQLPNGGWDLQRQTVELLKDIEDLIQQAEDLDLDVSIAKTNFPHWLNMVFAFPNGWSSSAKSNAHKTALDHLSSFATLANFIVPQFEPGGEKELRQFLWIIQRKLEDASPFLRKYAFRITNHLIGVIDEWGINSEFRIVAAMGDLQDLLDELARQKPNDPFWQKAKTGAWSFFKKGLLATGATAAITSFGSSAGEDFAELLKSEIKALSPAESDSQQDQDPPE